MYKKIYREIFKRDRGFDEMATKTDIVVEIIKKYIKELNKNKIPVKEVYLFGSYAKGTYKEESDIDIAVVSPAFTGDRFKDRRKIVPLRRGIDSRIEPIPFTPDAFKEGGIIIDEIKKYGKKII